ncbi:Nucleoid-associated protein YejK [Pantoea sp. Nvir]|nr:nucleoid-associated protein [Pantoea sp. Nvir]CAJ0992023.1 Nucleoid-associated protein YejK [Pantoea sp. Nvir]
MDFLRTNIVLDVKTKNFDLLEAVGEYCTELKLEKNIYQHYRQQIYRYCNGQLRTTGKEIVLEDLLKELPLLGRKYFYEFTQERGYNLEENFLVDRNTHYVSSLNLLAAEGGLTLNFDALLLGNCIFWESIHG